MEETLLPNTTQNAPFISRKKKIVYAIIATLCGAVAVASVFGVVVKQQCSATTFSLNSLQLDSLCSTTNNPYQTTLEVDSSCPFVTQVNAFDLFISANGLSVIHTKVSGFDVQPGKNFVTLTSSFELVKNDTSDLRSFIELAYSGSEVRVETYASVSGRVLGYTFADVVFNQELTCMNCEPIAANKISSASDAVGQPSWKLASVSGKPLDDVFVESGFTLKITSAPMKNIIVNIPELTLDVYEGEHWVGNVTVNSVQFGNGSSLVPLSTLIPKDELALIASKTFKINRYSAPVLTFYGADGETDCALQQAIAGVEVGSFTLTQFGYEDLMPYVSMPSIRLADVPLNGAMSVNMPLFLDIPDFQLFSLPDTQIYLYRTPSKSPFATLQISKFQLTGKSLSFLVTEKTHDPNVLLSYVNSFLMQQTFPVDILWTAGTYTIFELYNFDTFIDYSEIYSLARHLPAQFSIGGNAAEYYDGGPNQQYEAYALMDLGSYCSLYRELMHLGPIYLYYKGQYFGEAVIKVECTFEGTWFGVNLIVPRGNGTKVIDDMWEDLSNNRLPPGLKLIAFGNPNYPLGNVLDSIYDYLSSNLDIISDKYYSWETFGSVNRFNYGCNGYTAYLDASFTAGEDLVDALALDHLTILPNTATMNATLQDGSPVQIRFGVTYFSPVFDFGASVWWDRNHTKRNEEAIPPMVQPPKKMAII